jgi:hypothetical protein
MKTYPVTVPEIALVAITRGIAGAGLGLLLGGSLRADTRRVLGWALLAIGVVTTIPIVGALIGNRHSGNGRSNLQSAVGEPVSRLGFGEPLEND